MVLGFAGISLCYLAALFGAGVLLTDLPTQVRLIGSVEPGWLALGWLLQLATLPVLGMRWLQLMRPSAPVQLSLGESASLQLLVMGLNIILPGPGGDLTVSFIVRKTRGVPVSLSLAASIYARFAGLTMAVVLALLCIPSLPDRILPAGLLGGLINGALVLALAVAMLLLFSLYPRLLGRLAGWLNAWSRRWRSRGRVRVSSMSRALGGFIELLGWCLHATVTRGRSAVGIALLWSCANYLLLAGTAFCVAAALGVDFSPGAALFLVTIGALMSLVTILMPLGGLAEEAVVFGLLGKLTGATAGVAVTYLLLFFSIRAFLLLLSVLVTLHMVRQARAEMGGGLPARRLEEILERLRPEPPEA